MNELASAPPAVQRGRSVLRIAHVRTTGPLPSALLLVMAVLALGDVVFLLRALTPPWAAATSMSLVAGLALFTQRGVALPRAPTAVGVTVAAAAVLVLGGEGRWFAATLDWLLRDAVLFDLGRGPWPVVYAMRDGLEVLRAPVGMFVAPALAAHALGPMGAQYALLAQNTVLLAAVLALFIGAAPESRRGWTMAAVLLVFSGLDILGRAVVRDADAFPLHIERWAGNLEYSSTVTGLFWAPNHTLPALAFAGAYLTWRRGAAPAAAPAAVAALSLMWSPLAVIGMAPFVLRILWSEVRGRAIALTPWAGAVLAGVALLPCALFLRLDAAEVPHGWSFEWGPFWGVLPIFLLVEVAPLAWLALNEQRRTSPFRTDLILAVGLLLVFPLYSVGLSNDLMMRASTPSIALLAAGAGMRLNGLWAAKAWRKLAAMLAVLAVGAATPAFEVAHAVLTPRAPLRNVSAGTAWNTSTFAVHDDKGRFIPMSTYAAHADALKPWSRLLRQPDPARALPVPPPPPDLPRP